MATKQNLGPQETYLGDGVYARFEGYAICLHTQRLSGRHEIYLEPSEYQKLKAFAQQVWNFS